MEYYFYFLSIYTIGWALSIYFIVQKLDALKKLYKNITNKEFFLENDLSLKEKIDNFFRHVILQVRISNFRTKLMHSPVSLMGFIYLISPLLFIILRKRTQWVIDIVLILGLIGILLAIARRYLLKVPRIIISSTKDRYIQFHFAILINILLFIAFFYFSFSPNTPLLFALYTFTKLPQNIFLQLLTGTLWLISLYLIMSKIEKGRIFHTILAPINILHTSDKDFTIKPIKLSDEEIEQTLGFQKIQDFGSKDFLEIFSCTECGRCQEACPAFNVNQPLSPKSILIKLLDSIEEHTNNPRNGEIVPNYINPESIWSCTTCGACFNSCPVLINPLNKIINLRRNLVMEKGEVPAQLQETLNSIEIRNHPFKGNIDKNQVLNKLKNVKIISNENEAKEVDYIYWIGCAIIYNEQIQNISIKLTEILEKAGLKIGVLKNESCTGDPARRIGNEYLFQIIAQNNINTLKKINKKIITSCPHCYNTIKNEYPQLDEEFKVEIYHHSQILSNLVKENKIQVVDKSLTFHDPCYLGRQNKIFQEPRIVLGKKIKEMEKNKENSFCCGAGGGMYFLEKKEYKKINHERFEQAVKVSNNIATACPYCLLMLQDAANTKGLKDKVIIKDIVEWI